MNSRTLSIAGLLLSVTALVTLYYRGELFGTGPVSISVQAAAVLFMIWARIVFGERSFHAAANTTEGALVTRGPYAIVRNPIYAAAIAFSFAGVAVHLEPISVALALAILAGFAVRIASEERFLRERYPEYGDYTRRVRRLVPFVF